MRSLILFIFILGLHSASAQVSLAWSKTIGAPLRTNFITHTSPLDHQIDAAGSLYVFGMAKDTICGSDVFFLSELDVNGNELHQTTLISDSTCNRETPAAFSLGSANHILACGSQQNNQTGGLLFGLDTNNLSLSWTQHDSLGYYGDCIHGFSSENYVIETTNPPKLERWSESGTFSWSCNWSGQVANSNKTFKDKNDGVYMLVYTFDTVPNTFQSGFGLLKRDTINSTGWSMVHNPVPGQINMPIDVMQDNSRNTYVLTRAFTVDSIILNKISPSGQLLWTSYFGPYNYLYKLKYDQANNNILALIQTNSAIKLIRFDTNGALLDTTTAITTTHYTNVVFDVDTLGNSYVAHENMLSASNYVTSIDKINLGGGILWNYQFPTTIPLLPCHLSVQPDGSVYVSLTKDYNSLLPDSITIIKLDQPLSVPNLNESHFSFSVFPNPTSTTCFYQFSSNSDSHFHYEISDVSGRTLVEGKISSGGNGEIDLSRLSPSFYFISVLNEKGELITSPQKIVKL